MEEGREKWGSKFGFIMAAMGSAVGLGNIWMFSYRCGECGGAAFLIPYLIILFLVGIIGLMVEWTLGRKNKAGVLDSLINCGFPGGKYLGWIPIINVFLIFSFYAVIEGWCMKYMVISLSGELMTIDPGPYFGNFVSSYEPLIWLAVGIIATVTINSFGVRKGIERACKFMMPLLLVLLVILMIRSLTLPGAGAGIAFFTKPDLSKITWDVWLNAVGQIFFSLSLVGSTMVVYGSYLRPKDDIPGSALIVALGNTAIALMCGFVIFPAVFSFGLDPASGPPLAFITLSSIFQQMVGGRFFAFLFFLLLFIAALSSDVSMMEPVTEVFVSHFKLGRKGVTLLLGFLAFLVGIPCALSGWFLDLLASVVTTMILAPIGGIIVAVALAWFVGVKHAREEVNEGASIKMGRWWEPYVKYIYPTIILVILILGILSHFGIFEATW
jgi:NSS family neurotransmitter:Na+ symporter